MRLGIVPLRCARGDEQMRDLLPVEILLNRRVGGRAGRLVDEQDVVLLDQLAGAFQRARRRVGVVER